MYLRARLGLGYLPQEPSIFRKMSRRAEYFSRSGNDETVARATVLPGSKNFWKNSASRTCAERAATRFPAASGGASRLPAVWRPSRSLFLLDEPFAGIDPIAIDEIREIILYLKNQGIGILITDHNVRETLGITDRAYIMAEGKILRTGKPEELVEDAEVRRLYLGERFSL